MIRVEISKKELLRQLPESSGSALLQWFDEMPPVFTFDALPVKEDWRPLFEKYPKMYDDFTNVEQRIIQCLYKRGKVSYAALFAVVDPNHKGSFYLSSNTIQVHIKNLRKKLTAFKIPLHIKTYRGSRTTEGLYEMLDGHEQKKR